MAIHFKIFRTFFSVLCTLLLAATVAHAQDETVRFPSTGMSAGRMMAAMEAQTKYKFGFERTAFDTTRRVVLDRTVMTTREALDRLTAPANASYMVRGSVIILSPKAVERMVQPARTDDRYQLTDQKALAGTWAARPSVPQAVAQPEPEKTPKNAVPDYPEPYSEYTDSNLYPQIQHKLPLLAVKTNVLYGAAALAPNLSGEIGITPKTTLEFGGSWNRFNRVGTADDNRKLNHWIVRPEFRWWLCERFNGHFFGIHAFYAEYNISQHKIPMLFEKQYRYEGNAWGGGITYGYHWAFAKKWGVEFHVGIGVAHLEYKKFDCTLCSEQIEKATDTYFGPTRAGISLVFMIK